MLLLFNQCGSCLQLFQLLSYFQTWIQRDLFPAFHRAQMRPIAVPMCVCNRIWSISFLLHLSTRNRYHTATIAAPSTSCKRLVHCQHSNSVETTTIPFPEEGSTTLRLRGSWDTKKYTCNSPPEVTASSVASEQKIALEPKWLRIFLVKLSIRQAACHICRKCFLIRFFWYNNYIEHRLRCSSLL